MVDFVIVDEPGQPPILGLPSCERLNIIRRIDALQSTDSLQLPSVIKEFMDVFIGLGKLPVEYDIKLLSGAELIQLSRQQVDSHFVWKIVSSRNWKKM